MGRATTSPVSRQDEGKDLSTGASASDSKGAALLINLLKDSSITVGRELVQAGWPALGGKPSQVRRYIPLHLGEGIEVGKSDFAAEVLHGRSHRPEAPPELPSAPEHLRLSLPSPLLPPPMALIPEPLH